MNDIEWIDAVLAGHVFDKWPNAFSFLCQLCEENEISLRFAYHSGWFQKPHDEENSEPYLDERERGFTVEVGLVSFVNDNGSEAFYEKPSHAVHDGFRLLKNRLERGDE